MHLSRQIFLFIMDRLTEGRTYAEIVSECNCCREIIKSIKHQISGVYDLRIPGGSTSTYSERDIGTWLRKCLTHGIDTPASIVKHINIMYGQSPCRHIKSLALKTAGYQCNTKKKKNTTFRTTQTPTIGMVPSHERWTSEDWLNIVFADETIVDVYQPNCSGTRWRWPVKEHESEDFVAVQKNRFGKIIVWGATGRNGVGPLYQLEGTLDAQQYISILNAHLPRFINENTMDGRYILFFEDNAPVHTSKLIRDWKASNGIS